MNVTKSLPEIAGQDRSAKPVTGQNKGAGQRDSSAIFGDVLAGVLDGASSPAEANPMLTGPQAITSGSQDRSTTSSAGQSEVIPTLDGSATIGKMLNLFDSTKPSASANSIQTVLQGFGGTIDSTAGAGSKAIDSAIVAPIDTAVAPIKPVSETIVPKDLVSKLLNTPEGTLYAAPTRAGASAAPASATRDLSAVLPTSSLKANEPDSASRKEDDPTASTNGAVAATTLGSMALMAMFLAPAANLAKASDNKTSGEEGDISSGAKGTAGVGALSPSLPDVRGADPEVANVVISGVTTTSWLAPAASAPAALSSLHGSSLHGSPPAASLRMAETNPNLPNDTKVAGPTIAAPALDSATRASAPAFAAEGTTASVTRANETVSVPQMGVTPMTGPVQKIAAAIATLAGPPTASVPTNAPTVLAPARTMVLQLTPADLGTVNVRLHLTGRSLDVHLDVSDQTALGIVSRGRDDLATALSDQSYQLNTLVIRGDDASAATPGGNNGFTQDYKGGASAGGSGGDSARGDGQRSAPQQQDTARARRLSSDGPSDAAPGADSLFV